MDTRTPDHRENILNQQPIHDAEGLSSSAAAGMVAAARTGIAKDSGKSNVRAIDGRTKATCRTTFYFLSCCFRLRHRGDSSLHLARQVRHDTQHALDQHELSAMVHFVFLHPKDHLETRPTLGSHASRHGHALGQEVVRESIEHACEMLTVFAQQLDHLRFAPRLFFLPRHLPEHTGKIKSFERGTALGSVNALLQARRGDMDKQLGDRACFRAPRDSRTDLPECLRR